MVNHDNHKIVDILPSRDSLEVTNWLSSFKNLKLVTRDGSNLYKQCILNTNSEIIQVSDRFHLLKNLSEYLQLELKSINTQKIEVDQIELSDDAKESIKERFFKAKDYINNGYYISNACLEARIDIRLYKKLDKMSEDSFNNYFKSKSINIVKSNERYVRKRDLILNARKRFKEGVSIRKIAKDLNIDGRTISKYIHGTNIEDLAKRKETIKVSVLDRYKDYIYEQLTKGVSITNIYSNIKAIGYTGTGSNLRMYVRKFKVEGKLINKVYVTYEDISKLLYKKRDEKKLKRKHLDIVLNLFPKIKEILSLMNEFKNICNKKLGIKYLNAWITKAKKFNGKYLNVFIDTISRDKDAIYNSVILDQSNGIAEAKVNITKLTKRIMNGRSKFTSIINKVLYKEYYLNN